jgi:NAD(P)H-dependent FMN reductase
MITAVLAAESDRGVDRMAEITVRFVNSLIGRPPDHLLTPSCRQGADALGESDVIVVAAPVPARLLDGGLRRELERYQHGLKLTGTVAFAVAVGPWPTDGDITELQMKPLLRMAGATCAPPGLHVVESLDGSVRAIDAYCRYWRPAVPALVRLAKRTKISMAGPEDVEAVLPAVQG